MFSSDTAPTMKKPKGKSQRKWGVQPPTEEDMAELDFSTDKPGSESAPLDLKALVDQASMGTRGQDGLYEVKDWEFSKKGDGDGDFVTRALAMQDKDSQTKSANSMGVLGSVFARLTGSKVLTEADLKPVLESMKQHLMKKNVAKEIADKICEGVGEGLVGKKVGGFQSALFFFSSGFRIDMLMLLYSNQYDCAAGSVDVVNSYSDTKHIDGRFAFYPVKAFIAFTFHAAAASVQHRICGGERCRKEHELVKSLLLAHPKWIQSSHCCLRYFPVYQLTLNYSWTSFLIINTVFFIGVARWSNLESMFETLECLMLLAQMEKARLSCLRGDMAKMQLELLKRR